MSDYRITYNDTKLETPLVPVTLPSMKVTIPSEIASQTIRLVEEESFFDTVEGEGNLMGKRVRYMRVTGCTLSCAWENDDHSVSICDTPFSSHQCSSKIVTIQEAYDKLFDGDHKWVSISGGEVGLQPNVWKLVDLLEMSGKRVKLETNGTIFIRSKASMVCLSPKLASSSSGLKLLADPNFTQQDNNNFLKTTDFESRAAKYQKLLKIHEAKRYNPTALGQFIDHYGSDRYIFKFVIHDESDLKEIQENYIKPLSIPNDNVYLMPQGLSTEQLQERAQLVVRLCVENNYNYSDRLHVRIFGNKIGV